MNQSGVSVSPFKRISIAVAVLVLALIAVPRAIQAEPADDSTTVFDQTISGEVGEQPFSIPAGVNAIDVIAIGGNGGDKGSIQGGLPAQVTGRLDVDPESTIYLSTGGDGSSTVGNPAAGGVNGGGQGGYTGANAYGAGGGGATDIRTLPGYLGGTLADRVLVAGGGGGAGSTANGTGAKAGGAGGNAGVNGARAESGGPNNTVGSGGFGGGFGTASAGGAGGAAGFPYGGSGATGMVGQSGSLGQGGLGGPGPVNSPPGGGGGGGGGVYGGGGGGGGGLMSGGAQVVSTGGGGGGGGSSLGPAGSTIATASDPATSSINIQYTIPGTEITSGPPVFTNEDSAEFVFESTESGSTFECRIDSDDPFESCDTPREFTGLSDGAHIFEVRSVNEMGNFDPLPAMWGFEVDTVKPTVTIDSGPGGKTSDKRPEFTFSSSQPGSTFECRFDAAQFGACSGATSDRPVTDLPSGAHKFEVRATDVAGNVSDPVAREFEVEAITPPPDVAVIKLGKAKLNKKRGFAMIRATVNRAGKVTLLKSKTVKPQTKSVRSAGAVNLKVRAAGKSLKKLKRRGRVVVTARVSFVAGSGEKAGAKRKLTLKLKKRKS